MCRTNLQAGEPIECAFEDQVRESKGCFERIPDSDAERAVSLQSIIKHGRGLRMDEHDHPELLGLRKERVEFRVRQLLANHAAADRGAPQPHFLYGLLE